MPREKRQTPRAQTFKRDRIFCRLVLEEAPGTVRVNFQEGQDFLQACPREKRRAPCM